MISTKKGLSDIVTTLIIIALALVALGIVWYVVTKLLDTAKGEVEQGANDLFATCPADKVTNEAGDSPACVAPEEVRVIGGEYCCVTVAA